MPIVDVIMPAYNAARFLPAALESVIAQSFTDWRVTLVDDGSTDGTASVAERYQARLGDRLHYLRQENSGPSAARNHAIRRSSGEFLAMLDADDVWLPCRLERSLAVLRERPEAGMAYGFLSRIDEHGAVVDTFATRNAHAEGRIAPYLYMRSLDIPCVTATVRRECLDRVGLFDESLRATEDRDLWVRVALHYDVALVPEVLAHYRISPEGATTNPERMLQAQLRFIEKHYGEPGCGRWARRVALSGIYRQRAEALAIRRNRLGAVGSALHAFALAPFQLNNARTAASLLVRGGVIAAVPATPRRQS